VLNRARQVAKPDIDEFHPLVRNEPQYLIAAGEHCSPLAADKLTRARVRALL
jgi:hypothetical protein